MKTNSRITNHDNHKSRLSRITIITIIIFSFTAASAQSIRAGSAPSGSIQLAFDIKQHLELSFGYLKSWNDKTLVTSLSMTYKFKPVKTWYITASEVFNYAQHSNIDPGTGETSYVYFNALNATFGYQLNCWKRCDWRFGAGISFAPGYIKPVAPSAEITFGVHLKKYKPVASLTTGNK